MFYTLLILLFKTKKKEYTTTLSYNKYGNHKIRIANGVEKNVIQKTSYKKLFKQKTINTKNY